MKRWGDVDNAFNIVSICSGVGMLDLGFGLACEFHGLRARTVCYVEREASAAAILMARMEDKSLEPAPIWCGDLADIPIHDIRYLGRVDCVLGGIPCQPFSVAGGQGGVDDERWLWPLMRDLAGCVGARWIGVENVGGFVRSGLEPVLHDFAESGWNAEWLHISAEAVGASHRRERIFLLANAAGERIQRQRISKRSPRSEQAAPDADRRGTELGHPNSEGSQLDQRDRDAAGGAGPPNNGDNMADSQREPACAKQLEESRQESRREPGSCDRSMLGVQGPALADACRSGLEKREWRGPHDESRVSALEPIGKRGDLPIFAPGPCAPEWTDILARHSHLAPAIEPHVYVLVDGVAVLVDANRSDALRAIGNGVVPLQAAVAFTELFHRMNL